MSRHKENPHGTTLPLGNSFYPYFIRTFFKQELLSFFVVFLSIFGILKYGQYIFFHFNTSPAVILTSVGVEVAAIYLGGYRMGVPIMFARFLATLTSPAHPLPVVIVFSTFVYTLQAIIGGYVLRRLGFKATIGTVRSALILISTSVVLPVIASTTVLLVEWQSGTLPPSVFAAWGRAWAGGVFSIIMFTPLITSWCKETYKKTTSQIIETSVALCFLTLAIYLTFWTPLPQGNLFLILYLLFTVLFWVALRMHPRITAAALFMVATLGIAGTISTHFGTNPLSEQLVANELFILLIAPIFFILSSLVEERRAGMAAAAIHVSELESAHHKLFLEDQSKSVFLATLAHELRNPVAPVVSAIELMRIKVKEEGGPDILHLINIADTHIATLTHLLDDLLDITRISKKKFRLQKENVELQSVITNSLQTVNALYTSRNHSLSISMPEESLWIEADPLRLEQIFVNLLNNAAKYTAPGGHILLSVVHNKEKGLRIGVRDNGVGIEPHMLGKIFEYFIQANDRSAAGLGIGLSLTKRLVELHGGEIWAESEGLNCGSEFIVVLPVSKSIQLPLIAPTKGRRKSFFPFQNKFTEKKYSILIVDDNEAAAEGLGKLLEHSGHTISLAFDGPAAIKKMRDTTTPIVLLDIGLPGMDGYSVARYLRQKHDTKPLVLIALTGYGQREDKAKAHQAGFDYHLTKPVSIGDIQNILTQLPIDL